MEQLGLKRHSLGRNVLRAVFTYYFIVAVGVTIVQVIAEYYHVKSEIISDMERSKETF